MKKENNGEADDEGEEERGSTYGFVYYCLYFLFVGYSNVLQYWAIN